MIGLPHRSELVRGKDLVEVRRTKPRIRRIEHRGHTFVIKDVAHCTLLFRLFGRWWLRRELAVYDRIGALDGIPLCFGLLDRNALLLSHLDGEVVRRESTRLQAADYFVELRRLVARLHGRGVVHLDLGHRRNVLVLRDGRPAIVDFASALSVARVPILGWLGRRIDAYSIARLERRYGKRRGQDRQ